MTTINHDAFMELPTEEVAKLVRAAGPQVCVFPINGTRRWFLMEHGAGAKAALVDKHQDFFETMAKRYVELFQLCFEHGLDTILSPTFGPDLLAMGEDYVEMVTEGLAWLAEHPTFLDFYASHDVRVRFYGDYRKAFKNTPYAHLSERYDHLIEQTQGHNRSRLFFGLFAHDATESIAEMAVSDYLEKGLVPKKEKLVEMYYGEPVAPVTLFIGFDKFAAFDMPLVSTGNEDLYFTVSPSPYMSERQLRDILYDHLYMRHGGEPPDLAFMREFYRINAGHTLGVGTEYNGVWYPLPQVEMPVGFPEGWRHGS